MAHCMIGFAAVDDLASMTEYARRIKEIVADHGGEFVVEGLSTTFTFPANGEVR